MRAEQLTSFMGQQLGNNWDNCSHGAGPVPFVAEQLATSLPSVAERLDTIVLRVLEQLVAFVLPAVEHLKIIVPLTAERQQLLLREEEPSAKPELLRTSKQTRRQLLRPRPTSLTEPARPTCPGCHVLTTWLICRPGRPPCKLVARCRPLHAAAAIN